MYVSIYILGVKGPDKKATGYVVGIYCFGLVGSDRNEENCISRFGLYLQVRFVFPGWVCISRFGLYPGLVCISRFGLYLQRG